MIQLDHTVARLGRCETDPAIHPHRELSSCRGWKPSVPARFLCTCGAQWTVSEKELAQGIDHIEDHRRYALRTATRVD